jgi:L-lactate dehydrogenase complex protein LldE
MTMPRVGLLVTCLVDLFRPVVGFAAVKLLTDAGCEVVVPETQTCCGQPAFNTGDRRTAARLAKQLIRAFAGFDYLVVPSGSCAGMIRTHYPQLFERDSAWAARAEGLAGRTYELTSFLTDVLAVTGVSARLEGTITYHDSCHGLRELGIHDQPRQLLASVQGLELVEMESSETCCGFGGAFCVKHPEISARMATDKSRWIAATGAGLVLGGDLACLMNIAGTVKPPGSTVQLRHAAEVLAGMFDRPAIGEGQR